jgi:DNA polymerase-3 subunit epsilon
MQDFAAIDFETANQCLTSVCSVGIVVVRGGVIVDEIYELIRPAPAWYSRFNTRIHGLTAADTASANPFPMVWQRIAPRIEGLTLVAHNAPFDEGCLRAVYEYYAMSYPEYTFRCTCRMSRKAFPELAHHDLATVSQNIGYPLADHHHALADAKACAAIALAISDGA